MLNAKRFVLGLLVLSSTAILTGCGSKAIDRKYPGNKEDNLVNGGNVTINNDFKTIYDKLIDSGSTSTKAIDDILYLMAKEKVKLTTEEEKKLIEKSMIDKVKGGSYDVDAQFQEIKFVNSLRGNLYPIVCGTDNVNAKKDYVITPTSTYSDVFGCDYTSYIDRLVKPEIYRNKLVANYIYDKDYKSLGNSQARQVKILKVTDQTDHPGEAKIALSAFIKEFIIKDGSKPDLEKFGHIWKGVDLTDDEKKFKADHSVFTLSDKIAEDVSKIKDNVKDTDIAIESKYTGGNTYPVSHGIKLETRAVQKQDFITDGMFVKSGSLTDLPSDIKDRIYSSNLNTIISEKDRVDATITYNGVRFLKPATNEGTDKDNIIFFDAPSKAYFVVIIEEVVTPGALEKKDSDSAELKKTKETLARKVADELATDATKKKEALVHYFKTSNIVYNDKEFEDYLNATYPDIFKPEEEVKK